MKRVFFLLMAVAVVATGCVKDELPEAPVQGDEERETIILSATTPEYVNEDGTRTELDGLNVVWNKGDEIALVDANQEVYVCKNVAKDGEASRFTTDLTLDADNKLVGNFYISQLLVFPASGVYMGEYGTKVKGVEVSDSQLLIPNNIGDDCNISIASLNNQGGDNYNGDNLKFYNACGLLRLRLRGDARLKFVSITAPAGSVVVGIGTVDVGTMSFHHEPNWFKFNGTRTVTLEWDEEAPVQLTDEVANFYACVVPAKAPKFAWGSPTAELVDTNTGAKAGTYKITFTNDRDEIITTTATLENDVCAGRVSTLGQFKINDQSDKWLKIENPAVDGDGLDYVFDMDAVADIHVNVTLDEWNTFLKMYDADPNFEDYIYCDATFTKNGVTHSFLDAGLRLRGNTSRRRPEAKTTEDGTHNAVNPDWQHCHFMLNLRKFMKDDAHKIGNVRKIHLKWFHSDPGYVREPYNFDLFRRYGIWTSLKSSYCRLWIHVEGDEKPAYFGVYTMLEAIDERYLKARKKDEAGNKLFDSDKFNLWKCTLGADLVSKDNNLFANDPYAGTGSVQYVLKTNTGDYNTAKAQLFNFIDNLNSLQGEEFKAWINKVTDVELLLKTYAVSVACGKWDDYWCVANNYYIYFNSDDVENYKFFFIPYDHDNTLGSVAGGEIDPGRQNPLQWYNPNYVTWGPTKGQDRRLISGLLEFPEYRKIYLDALKELCDSDDLLSEAGSRERILKWQGMVGDYVSNDTGEDMVISDEPLTGFRYCLLGDNENNFFRAKKQSVYDAIAADSAE